MIKIYWNFLHWLVAHKMYYLSAVEHIIGCTVGIIIFALLYPLCFVGELLIGAYRWLKVHFRHGLRELKKGKQ